MSEINLLHSDHLDSEINGGFLASMLARLFLVLVIVAILLYAGLYFYTWRSSTNLKRVEARAQAARQEAIENSSRNEVVTRQEQLIELETLISKHVYWSYLLPELARVTLSSARYTEIEANSDGTLKLTVNLPSYNEVEKYMQIFDLPEYNQQFSNVRIVGIDTAQNETTIETQLRLELKFNPQFIKGRI